MSRLWFPNHNGTTLLAYELVNPYEISASQLNVDIYW